MDALDTYSTKGQEEHGASEQSVKKPLVGKQSTGALLQTTRSTSQQHTVSTPPGAVKEGTLIRTRAARARQVTTARFWRRRKRVLASIFAALLLLGIVSGILYSIFSVQNVTAFRVGKQQNVSQFIGGGGIIFPHQQMNLSFPVSERAVDVLVKAGDKVKPNQPLIKLDPSQLDAQLTQAANNVSAAQAYLNSVSNAVPYNPVAVAAAQQSLQLAQNRYNALSTQSSSPTLHQGNIISPLTGVVTAVNVNPGEIFSANAVLLTIMDQSVVTVRAKIPLSNLAQVHLGMPAQVAPSALPNLNLPGKVVSVIPQADAQTDTFGVWVEVANPQQQLLSGMSAFVRVQGQVNAFAVPRLAVLNPDHESSVFAIVNGHATAKAVHVVGRSDSSIFIDAGVSANDVLVLQPLSRIHDGASVHITRTEQ